MKNIHKFIFTFTFSSLVGIAQAQLSEWQLVNPIYSAVDPDNAGPATGTVSFTLQVHTTGGVINNVNAITVGWSFQSANAMIPTTPGCAIVSNPANVSVSPEFQAGGFAYTTVNQCLTFSQTAGGRMFDRRVSGSLDGSSISITPVWKNVFTVTLWTLGTVNPQGGYVIINSGFGGSPGAFATYEISDDAANSYAVNSLTYNNPLPLGAGVVPVSLTNFDVSCTGNGALVKWSTSSELNTRNFDVQKSTTGGRTWTTIETVNAAGQSSTIRNYQKVDTDGGDVYYRIKQVDVDGQFVYSDIKRSTCTKAGQSVNIYPVPAKDVLYVIINTDRSAKTVLQVFNSEGRNVRSQPATIVNGTNKTQIDLRGLAAGQYFIRSSNPDIILNEKFIIAN